MELFHRFAAHQTFSDLVSIMPHPGIAEYSGEYYDLRNGIPDLSVKLETEVVSIQKQLRFLYPEINVDYSTKTPIQTLHMKSIEYWYAP